MHACEGWPDSVYRWTEPPWASFEEIARVRFPYGLPYGFHGCWIPKKI